MGVITFNGISSEDLGIVVEIPPDYEIPERDFDIVHVPGRNGDVYIDTGSYQNVERVYNVAIGDRNEEFYILANRIVEWLHSSSAYARLEDSYEPDYYRLAVYEETLSITNILFHAGRAELVFNCKPQRFLKTGESAVTISSGGSLTNPTNFIALPVITVTGSGSGVLKVGNYTVSISDISSKIVIDSDIQDAYYGTTNRNSDITLVNGFPKLTSGANKITYSGGITSVEVIPNWWTL